MRAYNSTLYREVKKKEMEKLLMVMTSTLPYTETEIKRRNYKEFFSLMNRTEEIIKEKQK